MLKCKYIYGQDKLIFGSNKQEKLYNLHSRSKIVLIELEVVYFSCHEHSLLRNPEKA